MKNLTWERVQAWTIFEALVAFALLNIPSQLTHSLREMWSMPTIGPVITIAMAVVTLGFATMIAVLLVMLAAGTAQALGLVPKKS